MPAKRWLTSYSPGVPAEIDPDRYPSLVALLEASFARFAAQPAFTNLGTTLTFRIPCSFAKLNAGLMVAAVERMRTNEITVLHACPVSRLRCMKQAIFPSTSSRGRLPRRTRRYTSGSMLSMEKLISSSFEPRSFSTIASSR